MSTETETLDPETETLVRDACKVFFAGLQIAALLYPTLDIDEPTRCEECFWLGAAAVVAAENLTAGHGEHSATAAKALRAMIGAQVHTIRARYGDALAQALNAMSPPDRRQ